MTNEEQAAQERAREIAERVERATPGPWSMEMDALKSKRGKVLFDGTGVHVYYWVYRDGTIVEIDTQKNPNATHDIRLIYNAPDDLAWLLGERSRLAGRVRELEEAATRVQRRLWFGHGCPTEAMYGDDGEMQCGGCGADFKRWGLNRLLDHLSGRDELRLLLPLMSNDEIAALLRESFEARQQAKQDGKSEGGE